MTEHNLKIKQEWFTRVIAGEKTAEVRIHDRDYQAGDTLLLDEINDAGRKTDRWCTAEIGHVLTWDRAAGIEEGFCVLSLSEIDNPQEFE